MDSDLKLTAFAVNVIDQMSDASSIMQMKRMNVVAAELDRRARLAINDACRSLNKSAQSVVGVPMSKTQHRQIASNSREPTAEVQWDWGNDGVDAWPGLDVSIVSHKSTN